MRWAVLALTGVLLAGCDTSAPVSNPDGNTRQGGFLAGLLRPPGGSDLAKPFAQVPLAGGKVIVAGPDGYCIDPETLDSRPARGFAVIASCHILTAGETNSPVIPSLVTVTVGSKQEGETLPDPNALAALAEAPLLEGDQTDDMVAALLAQGGDALLEGGDPRHWRAAFLQGDYLVGLALYAPENSAKIGPAGLDFLRRVKARIQELSPPAAAPVTTADRPVREPGLLRRLFNR
ncbi:MAG: dihydroxy-acid dehydratase [Paracoccaceae bacterium]|nr:dihydroxy-acid dehydratase [Paracoccaceae bacterium]